MTSIPRSGSSRLPTVRPQSITGLKAKSFGARYASAVFTRRCRQRFTIGDLAEPIYIVEADLRSLRVGPISTMPCYAREYLTRELAAWVGTRSTRP